MLFLLGEGHSVLLEDSGTISVNLHFLYFIFPILLQAKSSSKHCTFAGYVVKEMTVVFVAEQQGSREKELKTRLFLTAMD